MLIFANIGNFKDSTSYQAEGIGLQGLESIGINSIEIEGKSELIIQATKVM